MKKLLFTLLFFIISNVLTAQIIAFIYEMKHKPNFDKNEFVTDFYYLDVTGKQSVFRSEKARHADSLMLKNGYWTGGTGTEFNDPYIIKNLISKQIIKSITTPSTHDLYFININDNLNWQIQPDKMKIGDMECQKATVQYGGRNWTAWFDPNSPLQEGPYIFHGLPGLIIKIYNDNGDYEFNLIKTKNSNKNKMFYLRKGKEISWDDYKKLQQNHYSEPFSEIKMRNIKYKVTDTNGNPVDMSLKDMMANIQKQMKEKNNPIELNHKVDFK